MEIIKALLVASVVFTHAAHAAKWELVSKSARSEVFIDTDSVEGSAGESMLVVRRNLLADEKRKRSQWLKYRIKCDDSTLTLVEARLFEGLDLSGNEVKARFDRVHLTFVPEPNMLGALYINKGCESQDISMPPDPGKKISHLLNLSPSGLMDKVIKPAWKSQDIESFKFNYSFLYRLREKMRLPPQGKNASVELPYYQYLLAHKDKIDQSMLMMDEVLGEIAGSLSVERAVVQSAFGIVPYVAEGSAYLRENSPGTDGISEGRRKADSFWYEIPGIARSKINAESPSDPARLFTVVYPNMIQKYRSDVALIHSKAIEYERKEARSAKLRADRERWVQTSEGKRYQFDQDERARLQAKEFPYTAIFSCHIPQKSGALLACFGQSMTTELELTNGNSQGIYKISDLATLGKETKDGLEIQLRGKFALKLLNRDDQLVLGVKIVDRSSHEIFYQKQVARFGLISVRNTAAN